MNRLVTVLLALCLSPFFCMADAIDDLEKLLRDNPQVQEKIYVHTDNSCYFVGDTLWYKAYVVRADNLVPTDMSKLLYVELLSPDGIVVERQHVVVSANGVTCGQFALTDSLYSGYYEIRAYTRWQMNFNVTERDYSRDDRWKFYGKQAAKDFFRDFEGLYSRVVPVYNKPNKEGNYEDRYMARRPKQHVLKEKDFLVASFYPEGGTLVKGVPCNVAFEVTDNNGQALDIEGTLTDGTKLKPQHLGRGKFVVTPSDKPLKATFTYKGKNYSFNLPKAADSGTTITYNSLKGEMTLNSQLVMPAAYAVLCRGRLIAFNRVNPQSQVPVTINTQGMDCPTGINEVIVYDNEAHPLASRLFFVNNNDYGVALDVKMNTTAEEVGKKTTLAPYAPVDVKVERGGNDALSVFSIAVRDAQTDERGYDDGNIMTDMLLSSDLKGFIAYPAYYFESDDEEHRTNLDLLMMVQGWRRYKRAETIRYQPERSLTFEGSVLKVPAIADILEIDDVQSMMKSASESVSEMMENALSRVQSFEETEADEPETDAAMTSDVEETIVEDVDDTELRLGGGKVRRTVLVEAELEKEGKSLGAITRTDKNGHFIINLPAYYDNAILFVKAYNVSDSAQKCMESKKVDKTWADERSFPDYIVKRDMFFPIFSAPYSWYQVNSPELLFVDEEDDAVIPETSKLAGNHTLQTVVVKARRRGKRGLDMTKPAIVRDAYSLYNDLTDYGLSFGVVDFRRLPLAVSTYFFGNMGRRNQFNIRALIDGTSFYRNYTPESNEFDKETTFTSVFNKLRLNRIKDVRVFTDYELRTDSGDVQEAHSADVTLDFVPIPDDGKRYTYRDRRYVLEGITYPEAFYSPDYSNAIPTDSKDYRRTLYWNPNARFDENGEFLTRIYNNCRETRVTVSVAGLDVLGQMYYK